LSTKTVPGSVRQCDDGGDLPAAAPEPRLEPLDIHGTVPRGVCGQAEQDLAVHLGEASQLPAPEQVIGVVDGAVVGADHLPGADWVVVAVDPFVPSGAPPGMAEQKRGAVVYAGEVFMECPVDDELTGGNRSFEGAELCFGKLPVGRCFEMEVH